MRKVSRSPLRFVAIAAIVGFSGAGCDDGNDGKDGSSTGTLSGSVSNSLSGAAISGASISVSPGAAGPVTTEADGSFSLELPVGVYDVTVSATNFGDQTSAVSILAGSTTSTSTELEPVAPVVVEASLSGDMKPGATITASVDVDVLDGSTLESVTWTQQNSVDVTIETPDAETTDVTLPNASVYKAELIHVLREPPITPEQLPETINFPDVEFVGGLQNRFQVVGVNPFALEEAGAVTLVATVVTSSGTYTSELDVHAELPFRVATGLHAVPIAAPVILHGRDHVDEDGDGVNDDTGLPTTYDWALDAPAGSGSTLIGAATQNPHFFPDLAGEYIVTVTDSTRNPGDEVVTIRIVAGRWTGAITGQGDDGRPLASGCTSCHNEAEGAGAGLTTAPDKFTPWRETGHAEIFTDLLNTSTYYGENCFSCHMVGFDPMYDNGGADEAAEYQEFLDSGLLNNPGDNWSQLIAEFPSVAQMANVQCENCHGPLNAHPDTGESLRTSLAADVCATCHGEPLRHARYQQWQLSPHANYELAIEEGTSGNCSRCHSANGFLEWLPALLDDDPDNDESNVTVSWGADEAHPQTCAACHDPHANGNVSGSDTNATVRVSGNTASLIAGFQVIGAGKAAICMTCHNSRRGLKNDKNWEDSVASNDETRAPHGGAQTDVIMGQNAYLVETGIRGNHSLVEDICVNCHMQQTPPPDLLAYNAGGTNHTFRASDTICSNCHGDAFNAAGVREVFEAMIEELKDLIIEATLLEMEAQIAAGNKIDIGGQVTITDIAQIVSVDLTEYRGRQAIIVTLADEAVIGPVALNSVDVLDGADAEIDEIYGLIDDRVPRAGWNLALAENDGSRGVHNPAYIQRFLNASIVALQEVIEAYAVE